MKMEREFQPPAVFALSVHIIAEGRCCKKRDTSTIEKYFSECKCPVTIGSSSRI
jgi:hypothetical protein